MLVPCERESDEYKSVICHLFADVIPVLEHHEIGLHDKSLLLGCPEYQSTLVWLSSSALYNTRALLTSTRTLVILLRLSKETIGGR